MIRITAIANSAAARAYYKAGNDYYLEGHEVKAHWHGKGAEMLGLSGEVDYADFERLCDNQRPDGSQLTARHIANRRVGYDFTFSVPKSVSVAASLGLDDRIADAFRDAVADTMAAMEQEMETRVRKKGANENRRTQNWVWADFLHTTSRPIGGQPDPQLHVHAVVFNATRDDAEGGQWKAGEFAHLKANAPFFQAVFRSRLASRLQDLGYDLAAKKGDFEIVGVPPRVVKAFSRRTGQIEELADKLGIVKPESKAKLGATSREKKTKGLTWTDLLGLWRKRLHPGELEAITGAVKESRQGPMVTQDMSREAVSYALDHLLERKSVVTERAVLTEALKHGLGSVTPESVWKELRGRKDIIRDGDLVSTNEVLGEEQRVLRFAERGRGKYRPMGCGPGVTRQPNGPQLSQGLVRQTESSGLELVPAAAKPDHATLSPSQQAAVRHVLTSPDRLILIRGAAGTGKTTLTRAALARVNVPWVILAPSAEASRGVLRRDGFHEADTLAKFLSDKALQEKAKDGLIWLDEASLAGARDLARLVQLADQLNARVVLSGDRRQHKSVARGDVLALLEDKAKLPVATVSEIQRQKGDYKRVAELLNRGEMAEAIERLDAMGWLVDFGIATEKSHNRLVGDYLDALQAGKSALVVVPTHQEGDHVTAAIRDRLKQGGAWVKTKDGLEMEVPRLGEEHTVRRLRPLNLTQAELAEARKNPEDGVLYTRWGAYREERQQLAVGDVLRTTASVADAAGRRIDSGATLTLTGWTDKGNMRVRTASGADRVLDKDVGHVVAGYVSTSQAGQGKTVDHVMLWAPSSTFGATRMDTAYTSGTRGRERLTLYTDDRQGLLEAVSREDTRLLASDLVRRQRKTLRERLKHRVAQLGQAVLRREPEHTITKEMHHGKSIGI